MQQRDVFIRNLCIEAALTETGAFIADTLNTGTNKAASLVHSRAVTFNSKVFLIDYSKAAAYEVTMNQAPDSCLWMHLSALVTKFPTYVNTIPVNMNRFLFASNPVLQQRLIAIAFDIIHTRSVCSKQYGHLFAV